MLSHKVKNEDRVKDEKISHFAHHTHNMPVFPFINEGSLEISMVRFIHCLPRLLLEAM